MTVNFPTLRRAKESDLDAMVDVFAWSMQKKTFGIPAEQLNDLVENHRWILSKELVLKGEEARHYVVAIKEDKVIGYMGCSQKNETEYSVDQLYTDENDCYAGSYLLSHALLFAENKNATTLSVDAALGAVGFYKKHGFQMTTRTLDYVQSMTLDIQSAYLLRPTKG